MYYRQILLFVVFLCAEIMYAQGEDDYVNDGLLHEKTEEKNENDREGSLRDKLFYGGNFSFLFGDVTLLYINPRIGYRLTDKTILGLSYTYAFYTTAFVQRNYSIIGPGLFGIYNFDLPILEDRASFFVTAEAEFLRTDLFSNEMEDLTHLFVGGGTFFGVRSSGVMVTVLFNVLHNDTRALYPSPFVIRFGVGF